MKKVYIMLTYTGTFIGKIIKLYTREPYSHASLVLDEDLFEIYSFGRKKYNNPFIGSFVREKRDKDTFKYFKNTIYSLYEFNVTDDEYDKILENLAKFKKNKDRYSFNIIGLLLVPFKIRYHPENQYYCAQFIDTLFNESGIKLFEKPSDKVSIQDLRLCRHFKPLKKGILRNFKPRNRHQKLKID